MNQFKNALKVYLTLKTSDGKNLQVLVLPIKESITEMLNDANFNANEGFLVLG